MDREIGLAAAHDLIDSDGVEQQRSGGAVAVERETHNGR